MGGWKFWEGPDAKPTGESSNRLAATAQLTSEQTLNNDEIPGFGPRNASARTINAYKAMGEGDMRRPVSNIDDLQGLEKRFANEFNAATLHLERRKAEEGTITAKAMAMVYEDLSKDRRYQYYQQEQEAMEKRLNVHWVDKVIDRANLTIVWSGRFWTSLGLMVGIGRTAQLWRTMDRRYAKLHGVSLMSVAMYEISVHTMKGALAAFVGCFGVAIGDAVPHIYRAIVHRDPKYHSREWNNVMYAATMYSLMSTLTFAGANYRFLGVKGIAAFTGIGTMVGTLVGYHVGANIYHPFVSKLEHRYDDPHWRPWYQRNMQREGNARHQKGRLL